MQFIQVWLMLATVLAVAFFEWWVMRSLQCKRLAALRAQHLKAQQFADKLLQQAREQSVRLQQELAAARLAARRSPRAEPPSRAPSPDSRDALMRILDEEPTPGRATPVDAFAQTIISRRSPEGGAPVPL